MDGVSTVSDRIRQLAGEGVSTAEIARQLGIRYQDAYGVLRRSSKPVSPEVRPSGQRERPQLTTDILVCGGFTHSATWRLSESGSLILEPKLPTVAGVYAFAIHGRALYVGVATMGLAKRIYFYARPGISQKTSLRINARLSAEVGTGATIEVYTAIPPDFAWNGLPVSGVAGLELGLIRRFDLPWNIRSAK